MVTIVLLVSGSTDVTGHFNIDVEVIACRIVVNGDASTYAPI